MLLAGEQFAAAMLAILTAVLTSLLAPDWMARSAVIESLTPPAHDSMSVFRSWTIARRSAARCAVDGRCGMAASVSPATSTTAAASIHLGVRSTGHPEGREAIPGRAPNPLPTSSPPPPGTRIPMVPPGIPAALLIRRGCRFYAALAAWMWHPRRMTPFQAVRRHLTTSAFRRPGTTLVLTTLRDSCNRFTND